MISISWPELIFALINFAVLLLILKKFLYKPFLKIMDERKEGINKALADAAKARDEVAATQKNIDIQIAKARVESQALIKAAQEKAENAKAQILLEAREEARLISQMAREEIEKDQARALRELKKELADMIVLATGKILEEEIDAQRQKALTHKVMEQMKQMH